MLNGVSDWLSEQRRQWRQWVGWLILVCYVAILYAMASVFWHVLKLFLFIGIFMALPLFVTIAFKFLESREKKEQTTEEHKG